MLVHWFSKPGKAGLGPATQRGTTPGSRPSRGHDIVIAQRRQVSSGAACPPPGSGVSCQPRWTRA
jgi:hypothetical protein